MLNTPATAARPLASVRQVATAPVQRRRVLLWIESSRAYGRGCILGVASYCSMHDPWTLIHFEHDLEKPPPEFLSTMNLDGIIARCETPAVSEALWSLGVPLVDLRGASDRARGTVFDTDPDGCAELAVEHFWERGLRSMAFCGFPGVDWSDRRCAAFQARLRTRNITPAIFDSGPQSTKRGTATSEARGELEEERLVQWLRSLRTPTAIFAANDVRGRQVLAACRVLGLAVPEEAAVLGVDNDEVLCELSTPPLSSIEPDTHTIGFEGAAALDRLMRIAAPAPSVTLVRPWRIITRQSTDVTAIEDLLVSKAASLIRENGCAISSVEQLAAQVGVSRATLERRFRSALSRSPRQEIDRVRLDRARTLVLGTDYPLGRIAQMVGYSNPSRLLQAYRRRFGETPGEARRSGG